jgi:hypothetical protein
LASRGLADGASREGGKPDGDRVEIDPGVFEGAQSDVADFDAELTVDRDAHADAPGDIAF